MSESQASIDAHEINWFWNDVGADVKQALTAEQKTAIEEALKRSAAQSQPADIRLHLGKYFLRITAGIERRNRERLKQDFKNNPIFVAKNAPLIAIFWTLMLLATLYALAFAANILAQIWFM